MARRAPKFEALVVNAIRRMQAAQGSTESEIAKYISKEYDVSGQDVRKQIQLTLRRGMNYGIVQKSKRGYITCDRNVPEPLDIVSDCYSCRRGMKNRRGRSSKRRSRSSKRNRGRSSRKRASCRSGKCGRRRTSGRVRKMPMRRRISVRRTARKPINPDRSKAKKNQSAEETPTTRQVNSRSNSKSPMRTNEPQKETKNLQ